MMENETAIGDHGCEDWKRKVMKRVLILEAYYGGSHKLFLQGLQKAVKADYTLFTLPARKWKMRMQLSAIWFAEQISILLLPWLIASVISGYSLFKWRFRWIMIEGLLLAWAIINLAFTYSRAGFINIIVLFLVALLFFHPK